MLRRLFGLVLAVVVTAVSFSRARADEGMWTFDNFPAQNVAAGYGFKPDQAWLDHVQRASVRLAFGCSGSFVSPDGLVMTNHHCAQGCISSLSTAEHDYNRDGFYATTLADEKKCPAFEINQLIKIDDVTARIQAVEAGLSDAQANVARKAEIARITGACDKSLRCDVVTLYSGGQYKLYTYHAYRDVHLVWAPEFDASFFGGDPDNFSFPRYDLDIALVRIYDGDKPIATPDYFKWNPAGPKTGELTFVSGNPGSTERLDTVARLAFVRDVQLPFLVRLYSDYDGYLTRYAAESDEHRRQALDNIFGYENAIKLFAGQQQALLDPALAAARQKQEEAIRSAIAANPIKMKKYGAAWDNIAAAEQLASQRWTSDYFRDRAFPQFSQLLSFARTLVRGTAERAKPDAERLPEYSDARLKTLEVSLFSNAPVYPEYEKAKLTWLFTKFRQYLTADDPLVKQVLGKRSPEEVAAVIAASTLVDPAVRKALWEGGPAAVAASNDPAIVLMRELEPQARAVRKFDDDRIEAPIRANAQLIGLARFDLGGTQRYPDATFTARLSYGSVKGYEQDGTFVPPFTTFGGLYERATGRDPFKLPPSWLEARSSLDMKTPFNFVTTNDIIGGNSGSPVLDRDARIVGLIFDGNIQSLGASFAFDDTVSRAVAVDSAAILSAMKNVYHADRLVREITGS